MNDIMLYASFSFLFYTKNIICSVLLVRPLFGILIYIYYTAIRSLYRHVVCNVLGNCKGDRNKLWCG